MFFLLFLCVSTRGTYGSHSKGFRNVQKSIETSGDFSVLSPITFLWISEVLNFLECTQDHPAREFKMLILKEMHHRSLLPCFIFILYYLQPYVLKSARMEAHVQLQIAAPALVDGLGSLVVKVCDSMRLWLQVVAKQRCSFFFAVEVAV